VPELAADVTVAQAAADLAAGMALLAAGAVTWARARRSRIGPLLALAGAAWLAGDIASALAYAHRGPLVHALLTYPSGRTRSAPIVAVIVLAYLDGLIPELARAPWVTIALLAAVVGAAAWRWAHARGLERRARAVPLACAATAAAPLAVAAIGRLAATGTGTVATWAFEAAIAATAAALAVDLLSGRWVRAAATGLVVDLAGSQEPRALRDALARTVGDPGLEIAYRVSGEWVDEAGQPVRPPAEEQRGARVVTLVEDGGTPVAALVHDPAALRDETLARSVAAAVRLALANVRLQTDVAARVREVVASRRRLLEAGDEQRRRLREQLRGGAEQSLAEVSGGLVELAAAREGETAFALTELVEELNAARADLAQFAQGVHPKALTERGLAAALGELARQAAVPVAVDAPSRRFPAPQEATAFFVCSEALANVSKYAEASGVSIVVVAAGSRLVVRVADDGCGGADPARGSGLRGLADRVEALGGTLSVSSPLGGGTRLQAELPIQLEASR
jgi:signal transduction histidine kinase